MITNESVIVRQILEYLSVIGATAGKTKTMGVYRDRRYMYDKHTFRGFPDITGFHKWKQSLLHGVSNHYRLHNNG